MPDKILFPEQKNDSAENGLEYIIDTAKKREFTYQAPSLFPLIQAELIQTEETPHPAQR